MADSHKEKIKEIYKALPKMDCGLCGFQNCGQFARAVAEGRASPFGCRQDSGSGYAISKVVGAQVPGYRYGLASASSREMGHSVSVKALGQQVQTLSRTVDDILVRLEKLKAREKGASKN
jgi:Na+-translocating ferredoxin:NAD+ oxidoreductase RNF subunit RnfB